MEMESTRQRQKRETRATILRSALAVFRAQGFINGKTEDIAKAAAVAHGTMFVHFPTRDDLLVAAVNASAGAIAEDTRRSLRNAKSVTHVLAAHVAAVARDEDLFVHLARESFALPERARAVVIEINAAVSTHLEEALASRRSKRLSVGHAFVFNLWLGLLNHHLQNRDLFAPRGKLLHQRGAELVTDFVQALNLR
jgi:AcrR family transcriptional regulator